MLRPGSHAEVAGFLTIATCRDGLKKSRDKSATSPFASPCLQEIGKSATSRTNQRGRHGFAAHLSRGRHVEVGIMEFELNRAKTKVMSDAVENSMNPGRCRSPVTLGNICWPGGELSRPVESKKTTDGKHGHNRDECSSVEE